MKRGWLDNRCVLCLDDLRPLTNAHVIPESVGGRLAIRFLCSDCNSTLGHSVEGGLKADPRVRVAIENLKSVVPGLAKKMREGQLFIAKTEHAIIRATPDGESYQLLDSPQSDGTRVKESQRAREDIAMTLRRLGVSEDEVAVALATHDSAAEDEIVELGRGLAVRKGSVSDFTLPFTEPLVPDACMLSIAYLFFALAIGRAVCGPELEPIRASLRNGGAPGPWDVESLRAERAYEPWHGLAVDAVEPSVVVQIRLLGQLAWRVRFSQVSCRAGTFIRSYHLDLRRNAESVIPGALWNPNAA